MVRRDRGQRVPGRENADEIERIRPAHRDELAARVLASHGAEQSHRLCKRVLLAREPRDEAAAADLAARLEPAVGPQDVPPRRQRGFTRHEPPEDYAVASEQLPGDCFRDLVFRQERRPRHARPPAGGLDPARRDLAVAAEPADRPAPVGWDQQRPQPREAVRGDERPGHELAEALLDLGPQQSRRAHEIAEERCAAPIERVE